MADPILATRFTVGTTGAERRRTAICVERTHEVDNTWAIRRNGEVYTRDGEWEYEPIPSSRDDDFLVRARWSEDEAKAVALRIWASENEGGDT